METLDEIVKSERIDMSERTKEGKSCGAREYLKRTIQEDSERYTVEYPKRISTIGSYPRSE